MEPSLLAQIDAGLGFKYYFLFYRSIVISQGYFKHPMEGQIKKQEQKMSKTVRKRQKTKKRKCEDEQKKQILDNDASEQEQDGSKDCSGWSSEVIQPAIKTMSFRSKRGTRMKDLIKGKHKKDLFWDKYQNYFGGDLNQPDDSEDQEDYQASSSGRDQFDSDFDQTDSYVGKRGRKKGTKVKRRKKPISKAQEGKEDAVKPPKGKRGRKRKVPLPLESQQKQKNGQQLKPQNSQPEENQFKVQNNRIDEELPSKVEIIEPVCLQAQSENAETKKISPKKSKNNSQVKIQSPKESANIIQQQDKLGTE